MASVRWTDAAQRDLEHAFDYLFERHRGAARTFFSDMFTSVSRLADFPHRGAVAEELDLEEEVRRLVVHRHLVFYCVVDDAVTILTVWDARRNPEDLVLVKPD